MSEIDLAYQMALRHEEISQQRDPGTSLKHPTLRKGIVTSVSPFQVDDLPASNLTQQALVIGDVVWMLVDAGRRLVVSAPARTATVGATASRLIQRDTNGRASVVDPSSASHIATKGYADNGDSQQISDRTFGGSTSLTSSHQALAQVQLVIPSAWGSWWNEIIGTINITPSSPSNNRNFEYQLLQDGQSDPSPRQSVVFAGNPTTVSVAGRGGSASTTASGTRTFRITGRLTINDSYNVVQCYMRVTAHRIN